MEEKMAAKNRDGVKERWLRTDRERVRGKGWAMGERVIPASSDAS